MAINIVNNSINHFENKIYITDFTFAGIYRCLENFKKYMFVISVILLHHIKIEFKFENSYLI